jgi:hypothetical protein
VAAVVLESYFLTGSQSVSTGLSVFCRKTSRQTVLIKCSELPHLGDEFNQ